MLITDLNGLPNPLIELAAARQLASSKIGWPASQVLPMPALTENPPELTQCDGITPFRAGPRPLLQCSPAQWHRGKGYELNAVPEQLCSPDVDA